MRVCSLLAFRKTLQLFEQLGSLLLAHGSYVHFLGGVLLLLGALEESVPGFLAFIAEALGLCFLSGSIHIHSVGVPPHKRVVGGSRGSGGVLAGFESGLGDVTGCGFGLGPADSVLLVEVYCSGNPVGELCQFWIRHPATHLEGLVQTAAVFLN